MTATSTCRWRGFLTKHFFNNNSVITKHILNLLLFVELEKDDTWSTFYGEHFCVIE